VKKKQEKNMETTICGDFNKRKNSETLVGTLKSLNYW